MIRFSQSLIIRWAYALLTLPCLLFAVGFLRPGIGWPLALAVAVAAIVHLRRADGGKVYELPIGHLAVLIGLILMACVLAGHGGWLPQKPDMLYRNPLFCDLIMRSWPPETEVSSQAYYYVYYLTYWLPAAWVGKTFLWFSPQLAWFMGNVAVLVWTAASLLAFVLLILSHLDRFDGCALLVVGLMLVGFSGLDALGIVVKAIWRQDCAFFTPYHLEWWALPRQYSSMLTQLSWVFNQAIPAWLCVGLMLVDRSMFKWPLLLSLGFAFAPFPWIGLVGFAIVDLLLHWKACLRRPAISDMLIIVSMAMLMIVFLFYYSINGRVEGGRMQWLIANGHELLVHGFFVVIECGLWLWAVVKCNRRDWWFWVVAAELALIPTVSAVSKLDWCMRVSIPALSVLMMMAARALLDSTISPRHRLALMLLAIVGAITPFVEIESLYLREQKANVLAWRYLTDDRLALPTQPLSLWTSALVSVEHARQSFFFRHFARMPRSTASEVR